jgi:hypothetical protein
MSMSMSLAALAKPIVNPSRAGRRAPARRVGPCVRARASSGPQWSTDKTLYGEEKIDLKEGERLQCVRTPTWISVSASTAAVRATRYATAQPGTPTPTQRRGFDPRLDRARFKRRNPPRRSKSGGGSVKVFRADRVESEILHARAEAPRRFALIARVVFARDTESDFFDSRLT